MKKLLVIIAAALLFGCTVKTAVPYAESKIQPGNKVSSGANASFILKNESKINEETIDNGSGITQVMQTPVGKIVNSVARDILPSYFRNIVFTDTPPSDGLVITADVDYMQSHSGQPGIATSTYQADSGVTVKISDAAGNLLFSSNGTSKIQPTEYNSFAVSRAYQVMGEQSYAAVNDAMIRAMDSAVSSVALYGYFHGAQQQIVQSAPKPQEQTEPAQPQADLPPSRPDTFAVVIGIDYGNRKDIPHLKYAASDAKEVYDLLTDRRYGGVPRENSILLLNDQATRSNIIAALRKAKTWDGYVYVYYTGHGAPVTQGNKVTDAMIVPDDAVISDPDSMEDTSVKISYIDDLVNESAAKGVLVALDACFTGTGKSITAEGGKPIVGMLVSNDLIKTSGEGKVIITSSAANQQSWEDDGELKSGIFSHYFIEGMKSAGTGVWVTINDLAGYLKDNVAKTAFRLKGQDQTPQVTGKGDFVVSRSWSRSQTMDVDMGLGKLKSAFEKGSINGDQLSRAVDELKSGKPSKLLQVFLSGKLDAKKFGELY